ncbi:MAG: beta-ketoacyl synthase [Bacteroidales bacterium]|nr:beta-ketoacyl synthase [Bacteroidales bacterium]
MKQSVYAISGNIVSPLGFTAEENFHSVAEGRSGVTRQKDTFGVPEPFCASLFDRSLVASHATAEGLTGYNLFETVVLLSAKDAIRRSGIDCSSSRVAFILSSIKGNVEELGDDETTVPVAVSAAHVAAALGFSEAPLVVSNACISGLSALIHARRMLLSGRCDYVVVTGAEVQSRFIVSGFQSLKALSSDPCRPFDADRCGLNLGEAAATMVLARADACPDGCWELVDGATRNDANHISGPSRTGEGSYKVLRYVLASCDPAELAFVNVHGTSTLYNDEMESIALQRAGLSEVPLNALKGVFGHTMGAAGVLESLISMQAADAGLVLGTRGFSRMGVSCPVNISADKRTTGRKAFIKLLSGFGGCNAAMLFRKGGAR